MSHALETTIHFYNPTLELFCFSFTQLLLTQNFVYPTLFSSLPPRTINNDRWLTTHMIRTTNPYVGFTISATNATAIQQMVFKSNRKEAFVCVCSDVPVLLCVILLSRFFQYHTQRLSEYTKLLPSFAPLKSL